MAARVRVGLLAADEDVRLGRAQLIDSFRDFQVVFEDGDGLTAFNRLADATVDLLLVNHRLRSLDGLALIERMYLHFETVPKIIVTGPFASDELTVEAALAGALATVTMDSGAKELIATMRRVRDYSDQKELAKLQAAVLRYRAAGNAVALGNRDFAALTEKQRLILELYAKGLNDEQSNLKLRIKPETQLKYLHSIFDSLNLHTRSQLVLAANQMGLV